MLIYKLAPLLAESLKHPVSSVKCTVCSKYIIYVFFCNISLIMSKTCETFREYLLHFSENQNLMPSTALHVLSNNSSFEVYCLPPLQV